MAKNSNFNFEEFSVGAIQTIDSIRSFGKDGSQTQIESRINAFYRALGLPVVIAQNSQSPDKNNGNLFSQNVLKYSNYSDDFNIRKVFFTAIPTQKEIDSFLLFNSNHLSDSIKPATQAGFRSRGLLFPMVVDGEIPVFPQKNRMGDAFSTDAELQVGTVKYNRPLIEMIVLMRLKLQGVQNQTSQGKVASDFGSSQSLNAFLPIITGALEGTIDGLDDLLYDIVKRANKVKSQTGINLTPIVSNIAQQSLPLNQQPANMIGKLDMIKTAQSQILANNQAIMTTLEFDDTFSETSTRNVKNALLASNLLSVISSGVSDQSKIKKDIADNDRKLEKGVLEAKSIFRTLDLLLGTFSGISGTDIIVVLTALFEIDLNFLLGLLNDTALNNLNLIKNITFTQISDVGSSIQALQQKVTNLYQQIENNVKVTNYTQKQSKNGSNLQ